MLGNYTLVRGNAEATALFSAIPAFFSVIPAKQTV